VEQWRRVGSLAAAEKTGDRGDPKRLPPPLPVCTSGEKQRHLQSNEIATTVCFSFPLLSSVPSLLSFSDLSPSSLVSDLFLLFLFHLLLCFKWPAVWGVVGGGRCVDGLYSCWSHQRMALLLLSASGGAAMKMGGVALASLVSAGERIGC
jgi:hypothetical protein